MTPVVAAVVALVSGLGLGSILVAVINLLAGRRKDQREQESHEDKTVEELREQCSQYWEEIRRLRALINERDEQIFGLRQAISLLLVEVPQQGENPS